jgi:hypothetical protein
MPLERDPGNPALWVNPDWNGREPGTFAFVVGVSAYDHLDGSATAYGLDQLSVSALTACRFFRWLGSEYYCEGKPLAKCWLLLGPTPAERAFDPSMPLTPTPSLDETRKALQAWYATIKGLDSFLVQDSRAIFFFSGHGLEMELNRQILLPSDFNEGDNPHWALSSFNLVTGLWALPLADQVFFIDACRNDAEDLRKQNPQGVPVFKFVPPSQRRQDADSVVIYAAGPGARAWQPTDPQHGVSVFGAALSEALTCAPGMQRECDQARCWVTFRDVVGFMRPRVRQALLGAGVAVTKPIHVWEEPPAAEVCEVPVAPPLRPSPPPGGGPGRQPLPQQPPGPSLDDMIAAVKVPRGWDRPADSGDRGGLLNVLDSEFVTNLLWDARVYDFRDRTWTSASHTARPAPIAFRRIARTPDRAVYRLDVQMDRAGTFWFELNDELTDRRAACVLPGDDRAAPRYTIELTFGEGRGVITGFDVVLADRNEGVLGAVAAAWQAAEAEQSEPADASTLAGWLSEAMLQRSPSPLAATVAALMLLRRRRGAEALGEWPGRLIDAFPAWPDGYVIHAEQVLRTGALAPLDVVALLLNLERTGLPRTGEAVGLAARQIEGLLDYAFDPENSRAPGQMDLHGRLLALRDRFGLVAGVFRAHGLCTTLLGPAELVTPDLLEADQGGDVRKDTSVEGLTVGPRTRGGGGAKKKEDVEEEEPRVATAFA